MHFFDVFRKLVDCRWYFEFDTLINPSIVGTPHLILYKFIQKNLKLLTRKSNFQRELDKMIQRGKINLNGNYFPKVKLITVHDLKLSHFKKKLQKSVTI